MADAERRQALHISLSRGQAAIQHAGLVGKSLKLLQLCHCVSGLLRSSHPTAPFTSFLIKRLGDKKHTMVTASLMKSSNGPALAIVIGNTRGGALASFGRPLVNIKSTWTLVDTRIPFGFSTTAAGVSHAIVAYTNVNAQTLDQHEKDKLLKAGVQIPTSDWKPPCPFLCSTLHATIMVQSLLKTCTPLDEGSSPVSVPDMQVRCESYTYSRPEEGQPSTSRGRATTRRQRSTVRNKRSRLPEAFERKSRRKISLEEAEESFRLHQAQRVRDTPALPSVLCATRAKEQHGTIMGFTRDHPPLWARAVKRCFFEDLATWRSKKAKLFTDGAGIEAPLESLRILAALGVMRSVNHLGSCEKNKARRRHTLTNFCWPRVSLCNLLDRDYEHGGQSWDMQSQSLVPLPRQPDVYVYGFSCKPFSSKNIDSPVWGHDEAQVLFGMATTISHMQPRCGILENVHGVLRHERLDRIIKLIRDHAPRPILFSIITDNDPVLCGQKERRPRVMVPFIEASITNKVKTDDELTTYMRTGLDKIHMRIAEKCGRVSFTRLLARELGSGPAAAPGDGTYTRCSCTTAKSCAIHICMCKRCKGRRRRFCNKPRCRWRRLHEKAWARVCVERRGRVRTRLEHNSSNNNNDNS